MTGSGIGMGGGMGDDKWVTMGERMAASMERMIKAQLGISLARMAQEMTNRSFDNSQVAIVRAAMEAESFRLDQEIKEGRG